MKQKIYFSIFICFLFCSCQSQPNDSLIISSIYKNALTDTTSYSQLRYLTTYAKGRLCGSPTAAAAVEYMRQQLQQMQLDTVYLQDVMVKNWQRGEKETASMHSTNLGHQNVDVCAIGGSIGTGAEGISAEIVEIQSFEQLTALGEKNIKGKIVFFNRAMDASLQNTFAAYNGAAAQRSQGAIRAATLGAIGVVVRSLTLQINQFPHTGIMRYDESITKIPAISICTRDAELLSKWMKKDTKLLFTFKTSCTQMPEVLSYNVIAELRGTEFPQQIIVVGGHLDSWDICEGAHDDGAGCMHSIEVLRLYKVLNIRPKHTIRVVLYMDEEYAQRGGAKYAEIVKQKNEKHLFALESDRGGLTPKGFTFQCEDSVYQKLAKFKTYFKPYDISLFEKGYGGVDIFPLGELGIPLIGFVPDSQRYFDFHHCANDIFANINQRELQMGSATITSLVYLIDKYGY